MKGVLTRKDIHSHEWMWIEGNLERYCVRDGRIVFDHPHGLLHNDIPLNRCFAVNPQGEEDEPYDVRTAHFRFLDREIDTWVYFFLTDLRTEMLDVMDQGNANWGTQELRDQIIDYVIPLFIEDYCDPSIGLPMDELLSEGSLANAVDGYTFSEGKSGTAKATPLPPDEAGVSHARRFPNSTPLASANREKIRTQKQKKERNKDRI